MSTRPAIAVGSDRLLWTAAIVVGASLPHWLELPPWIPTLLCACVVWRLAAALIGWRLPNRPLRLLLAFAAFLGVLLEYRTVNGVDAGSALLVVMIALKFLESHSDRDQLVLMIISYFLMFASLLTERLSAGYLLVLVWLTTVGLLQLGRRGPLLSTATTAKLAGRLLLHAAPLMVVLFVLFPRLPGPLWSIPGDTGSATTGLSDTMSPGDITELGLSEAAAFRVEFESPVPNANQRYWRGPVMPLFNGRTWSMPDGGRGGARTPGTIEYYGARTEYRVMLEPNGRNWAFALDMPESWSEDRALRMGSAYQLGFFFGGRRASRIDYRVTSYLDYRALEPLSEIQQTRLREIPPGTSPRTRALVAGWMTDGPSATQIIERALSYLRSQPFFYTLTPPPLGREPVDEFLFDTREGFCEHYASAFAVMMRAAGLPARIVTGYQGGELNNVGGYYIVRQSDAHAWTEVWIEDRGWVRVDPIVAVAPERVALGSSRSSLSGEVVPGTAIGRLTWVRGALMFWDAANIYWVRWVINYGPDLQSALLEALGLDDPRRAQRFSVLLTLTVAATVTMLLGFSAYLAWRFRRRGTTDPAARCFDAFGRRLRRLDVPVRAPSEGPAAYGLRAQGILPAAASEIAAIVEAYLRARYEPDKDGSALRNLRALITTFRPRRDRTGADPI